MLLDALGEVTVLLGVACLLMWAGRRWTQDATGKYRREQAPIARRMRLEPRWVAERVSRRSTHSHASKQRRRSLGLLLFGTVRVAAWLILGAAVGAGLLGISGFGWARVLAESVPFVAMISIYANLATDFDQVVAAFAALVASDSHAAVVATGKMLEADLEGLMSDIAHLAELGPGEEAAELAGTIQRRIAP